MLKPLIAKAVIYAPDGASIDSHCHGPSWAGGCPRSAPGAPVACAGRKVIASGPGGVQIELTVAPDAKSCPLAAFAFAGVDCPADEAE
jgi:hypothetical protein